MNYIKHIIKLEDKVRLAAILGLAVLVLILSFAYPHPTHNQLDAKQKHEGSHQR